MNYTEFLDRKSHEGAMHGFEPVFLPAELFDFQAELKIAIRRKCSSDEMPSTLMSKIETCFTEIDADTLFEQ